MKEILQQAFYAIRENRVRTLMSIVGIAVGIAAVMTIGIITQSGKRFIYEELSTYGLNSVWVYRKWDESDPFSAKREGSGISKADYIALQENCCPDVLTMSPVVYPEDWEKRIRAGNNFSKSSVEGVDIAFLRINGEVIAKGRNFRRSDVNNFSSVAVIGHKAKINLFGEKTNAIGKKIRFDGNQLTVIGVLKEKNRDFLSSIGATQGYDENERVLVPYTFYQQVLGSKDIHTLRAEAKAQHVVDNALSQITDFLKRRNNHQFAYESESMKAWIQTTNSIMTSIMLIGGLGALMSLIVGGIGIFNIMSASVLERTHEIGIRKAIGARPTQILSQFLMESIYISVIGGVVGILLGILIMVALILWSGFMLTPAWFVIVVAIVFSIVVGICAGYFPANRAAKMLPADALRQN